MKTKPKGPVPSLIGGSNGRPKRVPVLRKSTCYRCGDNLLVGKPCVAIPKLGAAYSSVKRVCDDCFQAILSKTTSDLEAVKLI